MLPGTYLPRSIVSYEIQTIIVQINVPTDMQIQALPYTLNARQSFKQKIVVKI